VRLCDIVVTWRGRFRRILGTGVNVMTTWIPALLCGACLLPLTAAAESRNQLTWDAFAARVDARCSIRMVLPDGALIEGNPVSFRPEAMDLRVYKISDRRAHPKGATTIPRETVTVVEIRARHRKGRLIGTIIPLAVGAATVAGAMARSVEAPIYGLVAAGGLTMGLGGPGGYFIGRAVDRRFESHCAAGKAGVRHAMSWD
jgi:hypothetical protein